MTNPFYRFLASASAVLLMAGVLVGCCALPHHHACRHDAFPATHTLPIPTNQNETLNANVTRIACYSSYHSNNDLSGDYVAEVQLSRAIPALDGTNLFSFEINFYVPREHALPEGCAGPQAYRQDGPYHFFYFKDSWCQLMTALNSDHPMYVRWDNTHRTADISADKNFTTPQPWPPLVINPTSWSRFHPKSKPAQ